MSSALGWARALETEARHLGRDLWETATLAATLADKAHAQPVGMLVQQLAPKYSLPIETPDPKVWGRVADLLILWAQEETLNMKSLPIYRIIRFKEECSPETREQGLTLDEAQAHCRRDDTHGNMWFDGYDYMEGLAPRESE